MNKDIKYFGIDISHLVFEVTDSDGNYYQFKNNMSGFKKFTKLLTISSHCVMKATGYYHYQLAYYLLESSIKLSVENPISVKRFIQMKLWQGNTEVEMECLQIARAIAIYTKQSTMVKNKLHGEKVLGSPSKTVIRSLKRSLTHLKKEMKLLEDKLLVLLKKTHQNLITRLKTIPSIGK